MTTDLIFGFLVGLWVGVSFVYWLARRYKRVWNTEMTLLRMELQRNHTREVQRIVDEYVKTAKERTAVDVITDPLPFPTLKR